MNCMNCMVFSGVGVGVMGGWLSVCWGTGNT
jgi:hypothetical protein